MSALYKDSRLYYILGANSLSAIGSGIIMITIPWLLIKESGDNVWLCFHYLNFYYVLLTPFIGQSIDRFQENLYCYVTKESA